MRLDDERDDVNDDATTTTKCSCPSRRRRCCVFPDDEQKQQQNDSRRKRMTLCHANTSERESRKNTNNNNNESSGSFWSARIYERFRTSTIYWNCGRTRRLRRYKSTRRKRWRASFEGKFPRPTTDSVRRRRTRGFFYASGVGICKSDGEIEDGFGALVVRRGVGADRGHVQLRASWRFSRR